MESRRVRRLAAAVLVIVVVAAIPVVAGLRPTVVPVASGFSRIEIPVASGFSRTEGVSTLRRTQVVEDAEGVPDEWEPRPRLAGSVTRPGGTHDITADREQAGGTMDRRFAIQRK